MIDLVNVGFTTLKCYHGLFILMNQRLLFSAASALVLSLGLLFSVSADVSPLYGQQNLTTDIGNASELENMTAGNIPVTGNVTDIQSQGQNDTSVAEGMQQEQVTTDVNKTG
jgi:hypothetical protein